MSYYASLYFAKILAAAAAGVQNDATSTNSEHAIFVGIHVRRTDYHQWMGAKHGAELLDETFFFNAAQVMRDNINAIYKNANKQRVGNSAYSIVVV